MYTFRDLSSPEEMELERRRQRRRRRKQQLAHAQKPHKHRTLLVSAIDEQAKVIHVRMFIVLGTSLDLFYKVLSVMWASDEIYTKVRIKIYTNVLHIIYLYLDN